MSKTLTPPRRKRLGQAGVVVVALLFGALAVRLLRHELRPEVWAQLPAAIEALPLWRIVGAVVVAVVVYLWLGWFDRLGFFVVKRDIEAPFAVRTGFMGYAIAHNLGLAPVTGTAFRARRYRAHGVPAEKVARVYGSNVVTMWSGYMLALGTTLVLAPPGVLPGGPTLERILGILLVSVVVAYVFVAWVGVPPIGFRRVSIAVPTARWAALQVLTGGVHWSLSALVLWLVLPGGISFIAVLSALCMGQIVAAVSHIPGGVGVLEGALLVLLGDQLDRTTVVAGVLLFRAVYYVMPLGLTVVMLVSGRVVDVVTGRRRSPPPSSPSPSPSPSPSSSSSADPEVVPLPG